MNSTHYDVIVCGTGGVGGATAYHLARRGHRVLGLDRFPGGHDQGSSHGETRIIRKAYFEHPNYVPLLQRAYQLWSELEQLHGAPLFRPVGLAQIGAPDGEVVRGVFQSARQHQLPVELWTAADCRRHLPALHVPDGMVAAFEREAGYLFVEKCVLAHLEQARRCGAELKIGESVIDWSTRQSSVVVRTERASYSANRLVLTAGAWSPDLLQDMGVALRVLRKHLHWYPITEPKLHQDQGCPTFLFDLPEGCFYGFPAIDPLGIKVAEHSGGSEVADPSTDPRLPEPVDDERVAAFVRKHLPGTAERPGRHAVCFYTMSPDGHFLVDAHPRCPQVYFAAGLSGHGFKFVSVLGEILADLCDQGTTKHPVEFLGLRRFNAGPVVSS